jgi:hypothetical protein
MTLAPVATTGSVQSTIVNRRGTDGTSELSVQESIGIGVNSYIWQPWFAQVSSRGDFTHDKTFGAESGSSLRGSGDLTLSVLPLSNYPVSLGVAHSDSRASGDFGGTDSISDRAFISASAVLTQNLRGGLRASWHQTDQTGSGVHTAEVMNLNLNQTFPSDETFLGLRSVGLNVGLNKSSFAATDPDDEDGDQLVATMQLDTHSEPSENLFYDSLITAIYDDDTDGDDTTTRQSLQGVSTMQWRPDDRPYVVTGSLRTLTETIERDSDSDSSASDTVLAAGSLGLRWPVNDRFSFNLGLRGSYEDITRDQGGALGESDDADGQRFDAAFNAGANYKSEMRQLSGFDWRWDARASADNGLSSDEGVISRESIGLGHRFERMLEDVIFVPVRFSFDQSADVSFTSGGDEAIRAGLSDSINFDYSKSEAASSTFARLSLRDTRELIGEQREFQTIDARIGRRVAISRERRLQGDLSGQATRQAGDGESDIFITASGNVSYDHRNLFDIENLAFRSELRVNIVNIDQLFGQSDDELESEFLRNDWRNVLTYRIGRLTTNLEATAFQRESGIGYLTLFRIRRDFGDGE